MNFGRVSLITSILPVTDEGRFLSDPRLQKFWGCTVETWPLPTLLQSTLQAELQYIVLVYTQPTLLNFKQKVSGILTFEDGITYE